MTFYFINVSLKTESNILKKLSTKLRKMLQNTISKKESKNSLKFSNISKVKKMTWYSEIFGETFKRKKEWHFSIKEESSRKSWKMTDFISLKNSLNTPLALRLFLKYLSLKSMFMMHLEVIQKLFLLSTTDLKVYLKSKVVKIIILITSIIIKILF